MAKKSPSSPESAPRADKLPAQRDVTTELAAVLQSLRTDVLGVLERLASENAMVTHRNALQRELHEDVSAATERTRAELVGLVDAREADVQRRVALVDGLLKDVVERLTDGNRRIDGIDARVSVAQVDDLVDRAARSTAERVYAERFQPGVDALTDAFSAADDRFNQIRSYVDQFGPGGLPVVAQERDALRKRVDAIAGELELAHGEVLTLKAAIAERDAAALRRRVVEGIDPETLDRRLAEVGARERDLDVRTALEVERTRLETEVERLRAALSRWEETGRLEATARVDAAQLERARNDAVAADTARQRAERAKQDALARMREAQDEAERLAAQVRDTEKDRASAQERARRLDAVLEENHAFARQWEEVKRTQSELERSLREREVERAALVTELLAAQRDVLVATDVGRRAEAEARKVAVEASRAELAKWATAEADRIAATYRADAERLETLVKRLEKDIATRDAEVARLSDEARRQQLALQAAQMELPALRESHELRLTLLQTEVQAHEERIVHAAEDAKTRAIEEADQTAARVLAEANAEATRMLDLADQASASRDALVAEINERAAEKGELSAQIEVLRDQLYDMRVRVVPEEERAGDLRKVVFTELAPAQPQEEESWLVALEANIRDAGFLFHRRLIRAFHTSLKIAHHAPLVILAGISGTGKSELPRLYADLGGVPFLPLAVQPSWDSPHDLFGFFNYTDGRLKAEPLARLLWQVREDANLRESPSIVLLDEMNLARVEYYFAELLSKLEARRGVAGSEDLDRRRRASVQVDTGPQGSPIDLYLDERVLFVGTMNQDESTLTLSDKVLDRACVLTFPAPRTMHLTSQRTIARAPTRLAWDTWAGWIREPTANNEDRLNEINTCMASLHRPFGHRLFRAIHAYIENYPGSKQDAFSDQFAMKIIPRLQGLECQSRTVRHGLDALAQHLPPELHDAFGAARDHEFFTWAGAADLYAVERG
jgi:hypothetical protein